MAVYERQATPLRSLPACRSRHVSTSGARAPPVVFVIPTVRLVPRWRRIASSVSAEPSPAEIATARRSGAGGCGAPVDGYSAWASRPCRFSSATAV